MTTLVYNGIQFKSDKSGLMFRIGEDGNVYVEDDTNIQAPYYLKKQAGTSMVSLIASNFGSIGTEKMVQYPDGKYIRSAFYQNGWTASVKVVDNGRGIFKVKRVS